MGNTGYHKNTDVYNFREGTVHSHNALSNKILNIISFTIISSFKYLKRNVATVNLQC